MMPSIFMLGDFGISKSMEQTHDLAKTCVGTPCYLAPEMCQDIPYSSKADVWVMCSLSVLLSDTYIKVHLHVYDYLCGD